MRAFLRALFVLILVAASTSGGFLAATTYRQQFDALAIRITGGMDLPAPTADGLKILYYRNPMGLPDTSPVPKKDSMGMNYIAVFADEGEARSDPSIVNVGIEKVQRAGVRSEPVAMRELADAIHAPGTVQLDERRQRSITMRVEGFVEEVYAGATGQSVRRANRCSASTVQPSYRRRSSTGSPQREVSARRAPASCATTEFRSPSSPRFRSQATCPSPSNGHLRSRAC